MQMKFYSPLTADFFPNDTEDLDDDYSEYEGIPYTGKELTGYRDVIRDAIYEDPSNHTKNSEVYMKLNHNKKSVKISLNLFALYAVMVCGIVFALPAFAASDPLVVVENLSTFIFSLIRAVGLILLGWGIVQVGLSLQSHDPSQRSQGFLTLAGGLVITFAKEILDLITA